MSKTDMAGFPVITAPEGAPPVPAHVPPELVLDTRVAAGIVANDLAEPYAPADAVRDPAFPRIHYYPWPVSGNRHGAWVVTRYDDIRRVYEDSDLFSTEGVAQFHRSRWASIRPTMAATASS